MENHEQPNYREMSGAEFKRAVGTDPEKWAAAFAQVHLRNMVTSFSNDDVARWFRDAMDAARAELKTVRMDEGA